MNGVHDMGGMDGFGKVEVEQNEPPFHAALGRPRARHAARHGLRRRLAHRPFALRPGEAAAARPISPFPTTCAGRWRWRATSPSAATPRATSSRPAMRSRAGKNLPRKMTLATIGAGLCRSTFYRPQQGPARFKPGDRVRTKNIHPLDAHAAAALRARQARRGRALPRLPHVSRIRSRTIRATIRNGSTPWCSRARKSGAPTPTRR